MKYKIATTTGTAEIEGEPFQIGDYRCAISQQNVVGDKWGTYDEWVATELSTGMKICDNLDKARCLKEAERLFRENDETKFIARAKTLLVQAKIKFPING